jgi:hypothetical protein
MDSIQTGWHNTATLYQNFKDTAGNSPFVKKANSTFFGRLATSYLSEMKIPYNKNTNRTEIFINKDAAIKVNVGASKDKDLPF